MEHAIKMLHMELQVVRKSWWKLEPRGKLASIADQLDVGAMSLP
jgi:hypothetical protein